MTIQELIDYIKQNDEVGCNKATSDVKIAIGVLKLKEAGLPEPSTDYYKLLRQFNGLSNNGGYVMGINPESTFFPNLIDYNLKEKENLNTGEIILGYDDDYWLIYNQNNKNYKIVDPDDGSEEGTSNNLADIIPYVLHI